MGEEDADEAGCGGGWVAEEDGELVLGGGQDEKKGWRKDKGGRRKEAQGLIKDRWKCSA